jgi:hypothetical protein
MSTAAQIAANRINAQRSTGPRTDDGKAKTRQNALRHGLCAGVPLMSDENDEEVQDLLATLREEHQPVGATEEILVYKMAEHFFYGKRASYLLSEQLDWADKGAENARQIALMLRYHTTADRGYYKALNELRKIQKERQLQEIGSVSQNAQTPPVTPPKTVPINREMGPRATESAAQDVESAGIIAPDVSAASKKAA